MPVHEISPGYTTCVVCNRLLRTEDVNTVGKCGDHAGKSAAQLEADAERAAAEAGPQVLTEVDPKANVTRPAPETVRKPRGNGHT